MAGLNDIKNGSELDIGIDNIKANFQTSQDNIKSILEEFIMTMPDFINLSIAGKTDYTSMDDFWSKISKNGVEPDIDDLIKYIEQNYIPDIDEKENGEVTRYSNEIGNLVNKIDEERSTLVEGLIDQAKDIITELEKIINSNEKIVADMIAEKASLEAEIKVIPDQIRDQEAIVNNATDPDKITEASINLAALQAKLQDKEDLITKLDSSINDANESVARIKADLTNKKINLKQLFKDNRIDLKEDEAQQNQQPGNGDQQSQNPGNGNYYGAPVQQEEAEEGLSYQEQAKYSALTPRDKAKYMLKMLQDHGKNREKIRELLDREGFGDIMQMSKYLGPAGRLQLRTIIEDIAKNSNGSQEKVSTTSQAYLTADEITAFMKEINNKTAKEVREFEEKLQKQKYAFLLDSTRKGPLKRFLARVTGNREFQAIDNAGKEVTRYFDDRKEKESKRKSFGDMLRVKVGKAPVNAKDNTPRLSRDTERGF